MKFFLDTAHYAAVERAYLTGLVTGVTTNPTHLSKEDSDPTELIKKIATLIYPYEVSVEITEKDPEAVYRQACALSVLAPNIVVKIPCSQNYVALIDQLVEEGIRLNITLVFSVVQGICMAQLGVAYISPFVGRLEDAGENGIELITHLKKAFMNYSFHTQILAASLRTHEHITQVALAGADIATISPALFDTLLKHPLTEKGIALFDQDWNELHASHFP